MSGAKIPGGCLFWIALLLILKVAQSTCGSPWPGFLRHFCHRCCHLPKCCEMWVCLDSYIFYRELLLGSCYRSKVCCFLRVLCHHSFPHPLLKLFERKCLFPGVAEMLRSSSLSSSKLPSHLSQSTSSRN